MLNNLAILPLSMKRIIIILIVVIGIIGLIYYFSKTKQSPVEEKEYIVRQDTITVPLTLSGELKAKEQATIRFATAGKIASVKVKKDDTVKKGQLIASLDQRELQNSMQKLLNSYLTNRWSFEQTKSDYQSTAEIGVNQIVRERAQRLIDQAQFSLNNAVLDVEARSLSLEFANLVSPISGIITKSPQIVSGNYISVPTQAEFEIVNPDSLYFEALADQTEITALSEGQSAEIVFDSFIDATISGNISSISFSPKEDEVGTVYQLEISLQELRPDFRLGMTGDVSFITATKENVIVIPLSFVTSKEGKQIVKVKKDSTRIEREVVLGLENDTEVEVLSGLSIGEIIYD